MKKFLLWKHYATCFWVNTHKALKSSEHEKFAWIMRWSLWSHLGSKPLVISGFQSCSQHSSNAQECLSSLFMFPKRTGFAVPCQERGAWSEGTCCHSHVGAGGAETLSEGLAFPGPCLARRRDYMPQVTGSLLGLQAIREPVTPLLFLSPVCRVLFFPSLFSLLATRRMRPAWHPLWLLCKWTKWAAKV